MTSPLQKKKGRFVIEENAGTGLLFAALFKNKPANYALLASNQYAAQRLYEFLLNFLDEKDVVFFPNDELLRAEALASSRELLSQRLYALWRLQDNSPKILITHPSGVLRYLPNPKRFAEETITIKKGDLFDLKALKSRLVDLGYQGQNKVERSLQFASRGDILDIFSVSYLNPVRIEFFGDEVDSIRTFDPQTQKSIDTLDEAVILPATDIFLNDDELSSFAERLKERIEKDKATVGPSVGRLIQERALDDLDQFIQHNYKGELYRYYGFALDKVYNVLNYFRPEFVFIPNHPQFTASATLLE